MSYLNNLAEEECCGCSACKNICPKNAISMIPDGLGFLYPSIDKSVCVDCGLCKYVCQFSKKGIENSYHDVKSYAIKHNDLRVITQSRSAGAFTAFSDYVLENNGIVYGTSLDSDLIVRHHRANSKYERDSFRKSKYVQSDMSDIFHHVEIDLKNNYLVMFSGTGCQCDGLRAFLIKKRCNLENLILVDIVCHGVPSAKMFKEYISWNERREKSKVKEFYFRDKEKFQWCDGIEKIVYENGKIRYQDYFTGFLFIHFVRASCYNCKYTTPYRNSDITLADFWGSEKTASEFTDNKNGCSLVLLHSEKAKNIFENIKINIKYKEVDIEKCLQPRLKFPREKDEKDDYYIKIYKEKGFDYLIKKYAINTQSFKSKIKIILIKVLRHPIKIIKRGIKYAIKRK